MVPVLRKLISEKSGLKKMDSSNKIRQPHIKRIPGQLKKFGSISIRAIAVIAAAAIVFFPAVFCQQALAQTVAIFDFDKRPTTPDPLARHIEKKLKELSGDIKVVHYSGNGDETRSIQILSSIEKAGYDLVITRTSDALIIAQHTLFQTPALYTNANNPLLLGFKTLGPPGGNISGASYYIPVITHLQVYQAIQPSIKKPGFIFDKANKSRKVEIPETREACVGLGLVCEMEFIDNKSQLRAAAKTLIDKKVDAIIAASSGTIYENISAFLDITNQADIPVYSFYKTGASEGAVAALSSDFFRMADELLLPMAEKVLFDKSSPGSMPAAFLEKNKLFINIKQADKFEFIIPRSLKDKYDVVYVK